jgi:SAM-dependent methyltransferase
MLASRPIRNIGGLIHERAKNRQERNPAALYTRFFRNPPQLEVLIHVLQRYPRGETVRFSVLGCSTGAEMYSALWKIGRRRPDLSISASGVDISPSAIETAKSGIYLSGSDELEGFGELFAVPPHCLFLPRGNRVEVNPDLRKGIAWHVEDARNPGLPALLGMQDIVFANNFLVHYPPPEAEACLSNILRLLAPGGFLFLWGVDPDVKARMVLRAGLSPCDHLLEEVYLADRKALEVWPWKYWGLEPLDRKRKDWKTRYATVFQRP